MIKPDEPNGVIKLLIGPRPNTSQSKNWTTTQKGWTAKLNPRALFLKDFRERKERALTTLDSCLRKI